MKRPHPLSVSLFVLLFVPLMFGQQADDAPANSPADNADLVTQIQQLRAEVERLSQQVDRLNDEVRSFQTTGVVPAEAVPARTPRSRTPPAPSSTPSRTAAVPATAPAPTPVQNDEPATTTALVFHDGHNVEARNYAIVGESIWVYTEQDSKRYKLADLDVEATKKVNSEHGVIFELPPTK